MYEKATIAGKEVFLVKDRREMLKVKVKSLAEEARIIRTAEQRTHGILREELHNHRVVQLRHEARCTCLAYGFIRGRTLEQMEGKSKFSQQAVGHPVCYLWPGWKRVREMVKKYGPGDEPQALYAATTPKDLKFVRTPV